MEPDAKSTDRPSDEGYEQQSEELAELIETGPLRPMEQPGYEFRRIAAKGLVLGLLAGCSSLIFNVLVSVLWPTFTGQQENPLHLIQVYLTFPLGESALSLTGGFILAFGCLLYLGTGMIYGMLFELALSHFLPRAGLSARLVVCSLLALLVWVLNFYGVLLWLQPLVLGGRWVIDLLPWWVAALTHLVFGWTMAFIYPLGVQR